MGSKIYVITLGAQFVSTDVYKNSCYATWMVKLGLHCKSLQGYMGLLQGNWGTGILQLQGFTLYEISSNY